MKVLAAVLLLFALLAACGRAPVAAPATAPAVAAPVIAASASAPVVEAEEEAEAEEPEWDPALGRGFTPGRNIGAVDADTAEKELAALYGAGNVERAPWNVDEGNFRPGTVVFKDSPDEFWLLWKDDKYEVPERAYIVGGAWRSDEGLRIGLDLRTLVQINGGDFDFLGFGWDYAGAVTSWRTGRLSGYAGKLSMALEPGKGGIGVGTLENSGEGNVSLASNDPGIEKLRLRIGRIDIGF